MKGIVFTEFLEMVENEFGLKVTDDVITKSNVPSGGVYTSVGTYDHKELVAMVVQLSAETKVPVPALIRTFGRYLFGRFAKLFPQFFNVDSAFEFLQNVESYIHPQVRKLYPDAELPRFDSNRPTNDEMELIYRSSRHFEDLAEGLIEGCIAHFGETIKITRDRSGDASNPAITFRLFRQAA